MGLFAPAAAPDGIVQRLHAELDTMLQSPQTARWARDQGLEIARGSTAEFGRTIEADHERRGGVIRTMGLRQP